MSTPDDRCSGCTSRHSNSPCADIEAAGCSHRSHSASPGLPGDIASPRTLERPPHILAPGDATGLLLYSKVPLSFWGGTDPSTGTVIDTHHDLHGQCFAGKILAVPAARGSCTGSLAILECAMSGQGPAGIILGQAEHIPALGALVSKILFQREIPVVVVGEKRFRQLQNGAEVRIDSTAGTVKVKNPDRSVVHIKLENVESEHVQLSERDKEMLDGTHGEGMQKAMELVLAMAKMYGAEKLIDVKYGHIDACIYVGPATLKFAQRFADLGVKFAIPTTLNAVSVDQRRWKAIGVRAEEAIEACKLADAYISMGASPQSFTCAPYLLPDGPKLDDQIVWGESNAVAFANSVLGARTQKYPDMLDVVVALTGRAPLAGCHLEEHRRPVVRINVDPRLASVNDDMLWPLLGYRVGAEAVSDIVVVCGLEESRPSIDDLKAFGAAYGTSSGSPMFHIRGITPEAMHWEDDGSIQRTVDVTIGDMLATWKELNSAQTTSVGLVALGNPHFSLDELRRLSTMVQGKTKHEKSRLVVTCGRWTEDEAEKAGYLETIRQFGGEVLTDTCWCMIGRPIVHEALVNAMTNSAKYAHYGPGTAGIKMHFGNLGDCVQAAVIGRNERKDPPAWLVL